MQVGSPGGSKLTYTEQRSHFALWAIVKSPLIIGADLRYWQAALWHLAAVTSGTVCALMLYAAMHAPS